METGIFGASVKSYEGAWVGEIEECVGVALVGLEKVVDYVEQFGASE
jgi:hypothetical protein